MWVWLILSLKYKLTSGHPIACLLVLTCFMHQRLRHLGCIVFACFIAVLVRHVVKVWPCIQATVRLATPCCISHSGLDTTACPTVAYTLTATSPIMVCVVGTGNHFSAH